MVKVTIEHDDGTEVIEVEMFFGVGTTMHKKDKTLVTAKTVMFGKGNKRHIAATGRGVRRFVDSLEQMQDGATVAFLTGLAPECGSQAEPDSETSGEVQEGEQKC